MKKCVLVNCFACSNEMRVEPIREVLEEKGYETIYVSSDFHHTLKQYVDLDNSIIPIHVRAYKKNLSFDRLLSHKEFSQKIYRFLCKEKPELIYIKFPPNMLVKIAYEYKKDYDCKIIFDLFDLWPESLPVPDKIKLIAKPAINIWAGYRDKYISCADLILIECDMYREVLGDKLPARARTLYLTKKDIEYKYTPSQQGKIRLCFIGGINNLINIELIGNTIRRLRNQGDVSLDIIGDGINREALIKIATLNGCNTRFHGIIYDESDKYRVMSKCDLGINLVKESVRIALSIKSVEYFRAGLGIINNVPYDTNRIINETLSGINISNDNDQLIIKSIDQMKKNARKTYEEIFSPLVFRRNLRMYFDYIKDEPL